MFDAQGRAWLCLLYFPAELFVVAFVAGEFDVVTHQKMQVLAIFVIRQRLLFPRRAFFRTQGSALAGGLATGLALGVLFPAVWADELEQLA